MRCRPSQPNHARSPSPCHLHRLALRLCLESHTKTTSSVRTERASKQTYRVLDGYCMPCTQEDAFSADANTLAPELYKNRLTGAAAVLLVYLEKDILTAPGCSQALLQLSASVRTHIVRVFCQLLLRLLQVTPLVDAQIVTAGAKHKHPRTPLCKVSTSAGHTHLLNLEYRSHEVNECLSRDTRSKA